MTDFSDRNLGPFINKNGTLFYKLDGRSSLSCDCIAAPYSKEIVDLWEWHQRAISKLRDACNVLEDGNYVLAKDICKFLDERA